MPRARLFVQDFLDRMGIAGPLYPLPTSLLGRGHVWWGSFVGYGKTGYSCKDLHGLPAGVKLPDSYIPEAKTLLRIQYARRSYDVQVTNLKTLSFRKATCLSRSLACIIPISDVIPMFRIRSSFSEACRWDSVNHIF